MPNVLNDVLEAQHVAPVEKSWVDENTGRLVQQLTDSPNGASISYFRHFRHLPDGRMLIHARGEYGGKLGMLHPETGELEISPFSSHYMKLRPSDGRAWFLRRSEGELWTVLLPDGEPELLAKLPEDVARHASDITCDGNTLIIEKRVSEKTESMAGVMDPEKMWKYFERERSGSVHAYDIASGTLRTIHETQGVSTFHVDTSPTDPTLIRFAHDMLECTGQRMFTIRLDGEPARPIRIQEFGEMITHEFWWADPNFIGYTYQDRRGDETVRTLPWCEYSPIPTRLGITDLNGKEVFLSDPLNSYHSHLYVSRRGDLVAGEGTDGHSFVFAAPFSWQNTKVEMTAFATIHTPYSAMTGQMVHADFSADSKWLLYNDFIDGHYQVCRVQVDF